MSAADIKEVIVLGASGGFGTLFSQVCMHPIVSKNFKWAVQRMQRQENPRSIS